MLILEGSDHLGKTTAAKRLVELAAQDARYPARYAHMSRPNSVFNFDSDYDDMMSRYAVQDRFHLGGAVWHEGVLNSAGIFEIDRRLRTYGTLTVVMYTSHESWYRERLVKHGKAELFGVDALLEANRKFAELSAHHADLSYNVMSGEYPSDLELRRWLKAWYARLERR